MRTFRDASRNQQQFASIEPDVSNPMQLPLYSGGRCKRVLVNTVGSTSVLYDTYDAAALIL